MYVVVRYISPSVEQLEHVRALMAEVSTHTTLPLGHAYEYRGMTNAPRNAVAAVSMRAFAWHTNVLENVPQSASSRKRARRT
jgi:hypothetical protein